MISKEGVLPPLYAVPWFRTLFADTVPISQLLAIWDVAFTLGDPRLLPLCAVSILVLNRDDLLACDQIGALQWFSKATHGNEVRARSSRRARRRRPESPPPPPPLPAATAPRAAHRATPRRRASRCATW